MLFEPISPYTLATAILSADTFAMEFRNHNKNEAEPKSLMSRIVHPKYLNIMKALKLNAIVLTLAVVVLSSCTVRLVDFTVISTKNAEIGIDKTLAKPTEGKKTYFLGIGWNIKDAADNALEAAGPQYDLLVDGVVTYSSYPFVAIVKVKGLAYSSSDLKASLGTEGYQNWCKANNVFDAEKEQAKQDASQY